MAPCGIGKKFIAELLGTFFLVFFGTGSAVITLMISESVNPNNVGIGILGGLGDWIAIALAFGLTVMVCIYLFGRISGAHLNPAVTIGLLLSKNISLADSVYYIVAQIIGACFGSLAVFLCLGMPSVVVGGLGATAPGMGVSYLQTIFAEFIGTFFLVLVIMGVAVDKKATPNFASKDVQVTFGTSYDIPVLCDVDGDGYADMGLCSVDDEEVSFNLHSATKTANNGYSSDNGRGTFDKVVLMPSGINPTCVCAVKSKGTTGIESEHAVANVSVYPTLVRAGDSFTVKGNDVTKVKIYGMMGQLVKEIDTDGSMSTVVVSVDGWAQGTYFVCCESEGAVSSSKLIVQ